VHLKPVWAGLIASESEVARAIASLNPTAGWARYQSKIVDFDAGGRQAAAAGHGPLLYGEFVGGSRSLHIRWTGRCGWSAVSMEECDGSGEEVLSEQVTLLGVRADRDHRYCVYWSMTEAGLHQRACRFAGFGRG
jgi:hypothetical protein